MMKSFEQLPWTISAPLMILLFVICACAGVLLTKKFVNTKSLKAHHDVAAVVFANLGVLYSVLLGFTVVNVQQRFDKIKENTQVEASYLADLYRDAEVFNQEDRKRIRQELIAYSRNVVDVEWPQMAQGKAKYMSNDSLSKVWNAYYKAEATTQKQMQWYSLSINKLNSLTNTRLSRLQGSLESLGSEMWIMLSVGAVALVAFICFFSLDSIFSHLLMASILAGTTGFLLFLIYSLDTAFSGDVSIPPEAMRIFLHSFA